MNSCLLSDFPALHSFAKLAHVGGVQTKGQLAGAVYSAADTAVLEGEVDALVWGVYGLS